MMKISDVKMSLGDHICIYIFSPCYECMYIHFNISAMVYIANMV